MKRRLLSGLAVLLLALGCHQGEKTSGRVAPDDVVGIYARQRGMTREQAEQCIRQEMTAARANAGPGAAIPSSPSSP